MVDRCVTNNNPSRQKPGLLLQSGTYFVLMNKNIDYGLESRRKEKHGKRGNAPVNERMTLVASKRYTCEAKKESCNTSLSLKYMKRTPNSLCTPQYIFTVCIHSIRILLNINTHLLEIR